MVRPLLALEMDYKNTDSFSAVIPPPGDIPIPIDNRYLTSQEQNSYSSNRPPWPPLKPTFFSSRASPSPLPHHSNPVNRMATVFMSHPPSQLSTAKMSMLAATDSTLVSPPPQAAPWRHHNATASQTRRPLLSARVPVVLACMRLFLVARISTSSRTAR